MIEKPEQDADLQVLDQRLRDRNASLSIYTLGNGFEQTPYAVELLQGQREGQLADGFNGHAAELVEKAGGQIYNHFGAIGFDAAFPTDAARTGFLRLFAAAARELPAQTNGIRQVHIGWKLGAFGP